MKTLTTLLLVMSLYAYVSEGYRGIREYEIRPKSWAINRVF